MAAQVQECVPIQPISDAMPEKGKASVSLSTELNYLTRWIEVSRFTGDGAALAFYTNDIDSRLDTLDNNDFDLQLGPEIQAGSGLVIGGILHFLVRRRYVSKKSTLNPLYRNFKTLANVGSSLGTSLGYALPFPEHAQKYFINLFMNAFALTCGLFALPYWICRAYFRKSPVTDRIAQAGTEGWSKYTKTALVYGAYLGQLGGAIFSVVKHANLTAMVSIWSGAAGVGAFIMGAALVPLINKIKPKALVIPNALKDVFRNNYIRTGITFGSGIGAIIGFTIGTVCFPGVGTAIGVAIGGAIGALIGGPVFGRLGGRMTDYIEKKFKIDKNTDNSWDYATRNTAYICSFLFTAICMFLPIPGGALIGSAIGNVVGWALGFAVLKVARKIEPIEKPAITLPWTQRVASGATFGSMLGTGIGFVVGMFGGPLGVLGAAALGGAIGGLLGAALGWASEKIAKRIKGEPKPVAEANVVAVNASSDTIIQQALLAAALPPEPGITAAAIRVKSPDVESTLSSSPTTPGSPSPAPSSDNESNRFSPDFDPATTPAPRLVTPFSFYPAPPAAPSAVIDIENKCQTLTILSK